MDSSIDDHLNTLADTGGATGGGGNGGGNGGGGNGGSSVEEFGAAQQLNTAGGRPTAAKLVAPPVATAIDELKSDVNRATATVADGFNTHIKEPVTAALTQAKGFFLDNAKYVYVMLAAFVGAIIVLMIFRPTFIYNTTTNDAGVLVKKSISFWKLVGCALVNSILTIIIPIVLKIYAYVFV
jgi:hypothetical protein